MKNKITTWYSNLNDLDEEGDNTLTKCFTRLWLMAFFSVVLAGGIVSIVFVGWLMYSGIITLLDGSIKNNIPSGVFQIMMSTILITFGIILYLKQTGHIGKEEDND